MRSHLFCVVAAVLVNVSAAYKFAVLSDLHMNPIYDPTTAADFCSVFTTNRTNDVNAPLGRLGCDPPIQLVEVMLQKLAA